MTRLRAIFSTAVVLLAALFTPVVAQADYSSWYNEIGCEDDDNCAKHNPRAAFHLQLDLAIQHKQDHATFEKYSEAHPGLELYMMLPMTRHVGLMAQTRMEDLHRPYSMFIGPSFLPTHGMAIGFGPGVTIPSGHDEGPRVALGTNLYLHSSLLRLHGDLLGDLKDFDHRASGDVTLWPAGWVGLGLMIQDDSLVPDGSLVGFRLELEEKPVNGFVALTGGLRGDENAGILLGVRLVPWDI